jgi:Amt family ammonium transporter
MGFRISEEDEALGIDLAEHAESAYEFSSIPPGHGVSAAVASAEKDEVPAGRS